MGSAEDRAPDAASLAWSGLKTSRINNLNNAEEASTRPTESSSLPPASNLPRIEINPNSLYRLDDLERVFGPELFRLISARCPQIAGWVHGQHWNEALLRTIGEAHSQSDRHSTKVQDPATINHSQDVFITLGAAARYLGVSPRTLSRYLNENLIEYVNLSKQKGGNRKVQITRQALDVFRRRCAVPAKPPVKARTLPVRPRRRT